MKKEITDIDRALASYSIIEATGKEEIAIPTPRDAKSVLDEIAKRTQEREMRNAKSAKLAKRPENRFARNMLAAKNDETRILERDAKAEKKRAKLAREYAPCEGPARVAMVSRAIVSQIENPKTRATGKDGTVKQAGAPRKLSPSDIEEITGIVSLELAKAGAFYGETLTGEVWNACFNSVRENETGLNLNVKRSFDLSVLYGQDFRVNASAKRRIVARRAQLHRYIIASHKSDDSRQATGNLKKALALLESAFSLAMGNGTECLDDSFRNRLMYDESASQDARTLESNRSSETRARAQKWFVAYVARGREAIAKGTGTPALENPVIR
jgi:hypothetical protein